MGPILIKPVSAARTLSLASAKPPPWMLRQGTSQVKPREERQKVLIRARMRSGVSWHDVCILNLSGRGLGIQSAEPPPRGTYVEICRGSQIVLARVMWAKGHRAGLHSQDIIAVRALIRDDPANDHGAQRAYPKVERRRAQRHLQERHDRSRIAGRAIEFACFGLVAAVFGLTVFGTVEEALARPLAQVREVLNQQ